jgi:hypothetical protein
MLYVYILLLGAALAILFSSKRSALAHKSKHLRAKEFVVACKQWFAAAKTDSDAVQAVVHVTTSAAFLSAARALMPDNELSQLVSIDGLYDAIQRESQARIRDLRRAIRKADLSSRKQHALEN